MVININKIISFLFCLILLSCNASYKKQENVNEEFPNPLGNVNDFSKLLLKGQVKNLERRIDSFENKTTNQIAIVIMDSVPYNINLYTTNLGNKWGVGLKSKDNGLVLLVAKEQRKIRISTGLGTEKVLTDSICSQIIVEEIAPNFKEGRFYGGLNNALSSIFLKWQINE